MHNTSLPENLSKLKYQLDKGNNLIDYFVICGVKPSICLYENLYKFNDKNYLNNIQLKPEILSQCPTFEKSILKFDSNIIKFCFPEGFKIILSKKEPEIKFNTFILDNALNSFNYPQKYISCLIFYESIKKYKKLKDKLDGNFYLNETLADSINSSQIKFENNKIPITSKKSPYYKSQYYYIPKCICLISIYPFFNIHQQILLSLYQCVVFSSSQIPIEKIIENLIIEVPIPPRGLYNIEYLLLNKKIFLKNHKINKIPLCHVKLEKIYRLLNINIILDVIKHIYYESKILFFSTDLNILCKVLLAFISLIFPYKYPHQIISYLPKENYKTLESISPFMFGINEKFKLSFFEDNDIEIFGSNFFIIDIENKTTKLISNEEIPSFPNQAKLLFEKDMKRFLNNYNNNKNLTEQQFNNNFLKIFFDFHLEIIKDYENYLNEDYFKSNEDIQNANIYTLFQVDKFLKDHSNERKFYEKFITESNMFSELIYKRMIPKNNFEMTEILLIKDELTEKENKNKYFRKEETKFLLSKLYNKTNIYAVQKTRELSEKEIELVSKDYLNQLFKAQEISILKNKRINFTYLLFPILNMDLFFNNNNINEYFPPPDFSEEIDLISTDVISKSYLGSYKINKIEMKNYIYLTWIELWAFSFWYFDKKEKKYRFNQLIQILDKVIHHEMEIFNLLFNVLNQNNEKEMILKLYQKLILLKLHPSTYIYDIINKLIDSNQIKLLNEQNKNNIYFSSYDSPVTFRKRTLKNKYEKKVLTSKIKFFKYDNCIECQRLINLYDLTLNFKNIKNDIMWVSCEKNHNNLPKIKIKFGEELNTQGNFFGIEGKTQNIDEVVLHSPYNIKINVKNAILREYGFKLNIDNFKSQFTPLFWNCIWYFSIYELSFDFFLPYEKNIENSNCIHFQNQNSFKTGFINNNQFNLLKKKIENKKKKKKKFFHHKDLLINHEIENLNFKEIKNKRIRNYSISTFNQSQNIITERSFINNDMIEGSINFAINFDSISKLNDFSSSFIENNSPIKFKNKNKNIFEDENFNHKEFEIDSDNIKFDSFDLNNFNNNSFNLEKNNIFNIKGLNIESNYLCNKGIIKSKSCQFIKTKKYDFFYS